MKKLVLRWVALALFLILLALVFIATTVRLLLALVCHAL